MIKKIIEKYSQPEEFKEITSVDINVGSLDRDSFYVSFYIFQGSGHIAWSGYITKRPDIKLCQEFQNKFMKKKRLT